MLIELSCCEDTGYYPASNSRVPFFLCICLCPWLPLFAATFGRHLAVSSDAPFYLTPKLPAHAKVTTATLVADVVGVVVVVAVVVTFSPVVIALSCQIWLYVVAAAVILCTFINHNNTFIYLALANPCSLPFPSQLLFLPFSCAFLSILSSKLLSFTIDQLCNLYAIKIIIFNKFWSKQLN